MKKLFVLTAVLLALPGLLSAATVLKDGDPGMYLYFLETGEIVAGGTYCDVIGPANLGTVSSCSEDDTFCMHYWDDLGWLTFSNDFPEGEAFELPAGSYYGPYEACITAPCEGTTIGMVNTFYAMMAYTDIYEVCQPDSGDCEDPNVLGSGPRWQVCSIELTIVASPPGLSIVQDSLYLIEEGMTAAYVPFSIYNTDPCSPPLNYNYHIVSLGYVGTALEVNDAVMVPGGTYVNVYGIVNASLAEVCDYDTLTIIAWDDEGTLYDTCVQIIHIVEPVPVPLFSTPVVTILVLAMILAAAVIMKRTAVNKA